MCEHRDVHVHAKKHDALFRLLYFVAFSYSYLRLHATQSHFVSVENTASLGPPARGWHVWCGPLLSSAENTQVRRVTFGRCAYCNTAVRQASLKLCNRRPRTSMAAAPVSHSLELCFS